MNYPDMPHWIKKDLNVTYMVFGDLGTYTNANPASFAISEYQAFQFHFHAPSEHTINGNYYDLEMHIVHNAISQPLTEYMSMAVIAILFKLGNTESELLN